MCSTKGVTFNKLNIMTRAFVMMVFVTTGLFSCGQNNNSTTNTIVSEPSEEPVFTEQPNIQNNKSKYTDTEYLYSDSTGKRLIFQNGLPKGGLKYASTNGEEYVYAVFWTRITNETDNPLEITIDFPQDSIVLPSSKGRYFKVLISQDKMTPDNEPLFNYGLDLEFFLNTYLHKPTSLRRTINSKESSGFYIVTLFNKGVDGTLRSGLSLNENKLYYRINDKEIHCGKLFFEINNRK
jgi:hypothetical protein